MEKFLLSAIFALAFLIYSPLASAGEIHLLSVTGSGTVNSAPDVASISVGVSTFSKDAGTAQIQNANSAQAIVNAIVALGIDRKDIHTSKTLSDQSYNNSNNTNNDNY